MKGGKEDLKSKGKGKGTLFSFFSKAPAPKSANSTTPSKQPAAKAASNTPSTAQSTPEQSSGEVEDLLGKRIKVMSHI